MYTPRMNRPIMRTTPPNETMCVYTVNQLLVHIDLITRFQCVAYSRPDKGKYETLMLTPQLVSDTYWGDTVYSLLTAPDYVSYLIACYDSYTEG